MEDHSDLSGEDGEPGLSPGFDQLAAYRAAPKVGELANIGAVKEQLRLKRLQIEELLEYAGPAGSGAAQGFLLEVTELEGELAWLERVARGEELSQEYLERQARVKPQGSPRPRLAALAEAGSRTTAEAPDLDLELAGNAREALS